MSLPVAVDAYFGHKANERPREFTVDEGLYEIAEVEDRWYEPEAVYFRVRTTKANKARDSSCATTNRKTNGHYTRSMVMSCWRDRAFD